MNPYSPTRGTNHRQHHPNAPRSPPQVKMSIIFIMKTMIMMMMKLLLMVIPTGNRGHALGVCVGCVRRVLISGHRARCAVECLFVRSPKIYAASRRRIGTRATRMTVAECEKCRMPQNTPRLRARPFGRRSRIYRR
jgi:hypothetical protein